MIYSYIPLTQNKPIGGVGALMEYIYSINQIAGISAGAVLSNSPYIKDWLESHLKLRKSLTSKGYSAY